MADSFKIEIQGLAELQKQLGGGLPKKLTDKLDYVMEKNVRQIELLANQLKPTDMGFMQVRVDSQYLNKEITVNANYAAFMEFGTGMYAAQYVATLPSDWQQYAAQFKGQSGGGTFAEMILHLQEWAQRQGMSNPKQAGYVIAKSIIINGVHPHPFLYPAFNQVLPTMQAELQNVVDTFAL